MNSNIKSPFADPALSDEEMKYVTESVERWELTPPEMILFGK